jgi:hypothetical protein
VLSFERAEKPKPRERFTVAVSEGVEACSAIMHEQDAFIGIREVWGGDMPFLLRAADRRQHVYVIGKTGTGKSTLLRNLIVQDLEAGRGVGLIDPHGDLAEELLDFIPPWRTDHVVYFNPADREYPVGFNVLAANSIEERQLVASGLVSIFKSIWKDSWGPRLEYILSAAVAALQECENVSLLGLQRMLVDARYRQWVVRQVKDPIVRAFWLVEYDGYDSRLLSESIAPIQNKVGQLLISPTIRNILGQVRSTFDVSFVMNKKRIFIANLAKGRIGEDKSNLLGALLVSQFHLAALKRAAMPEPERQDFHLFVDEFPSFATDSFASILSESRKYHLSLVLAHQYLGQLREEIRDAVFGNVGTMIAFRTGEPDGRLLAREFGSGYTSEHLTTLGNFQGRVKLLHDGAHEEPFLARMSLPLGVRYDRRENVIRRSRERFTTSRATVEERIRRWMRP